MKKIIIIVVLFTTGLSINSTGQSKHRFWKDVQVIKKYDHIYAPPKDPILFIGSSSIRKWPDPQKTFYRHTILDRGIGGAVLNDFIFYANDLIFRYHPKQIIMYLGENDVLHHKETPDSILNRFKRLYHLIRSKLPDIPFDYIAMKPSPVRQKYWEKEKRANALIANFLKYQKNARFINIFPLLVTKDGKPRPELFQKDMLHMNTKGYAIWNKILKKYLIN